MSVMMSPLPVRDAYDALTRKLRYPSSQTLRRIYEVACSPEEAQLLVELPSTIDGLATKLDRDPKAVADQIERMFFVGLLAESPAPEGGLMYVPAHCIEAASDWMLWTMGGQELPRGSKITAADIKASLSERSQTLCELWEKFFHEEWYRWQRPDELVHRRVELLGGEAGLARTFGIQPALKALEKSEALGTEILPEWDLREYARQGEKGIYTRNCTCRTRAKGCDFPIWTCGAQWEGMPGRDIAAEIKADRRNQLHKFSGEEWLEIMIRGEEDMMMVHMGDSWLNGCNCCRDCCNWLKPLGMYTDPWEGVHPSPYRAVVNTEVCEGCLKHCVSRCAFKVIKSEKNPSNGKVKAFIDPGKCVGCGQCVIGCPVEGALKLDLAEKAGSVVPVMGGREKVSDHIVWKNPIAAH